jgi:PAS domain S-box-containing protein
MRVKEPNDPRTPEELAEELAEELEAFYELTTDLICVAGADGYFRRVNKAWEACLGHTTAELLAVPYREFVHPDDRVDTATAARQLEAGELYAFRNRYRHKDGSYRVLAWRATRWSGGLTYAIARDITAESAPSALTAAGGALPAD